MEIDELSRERESFFEAPAPSELILTFSQNSNGRRFRGTNVAEYVRR